MEVRLVRKDPRQPSNSSSFCSPIFSLREESTKSEGIGFDVLEGEMLFVINCFFESADSLRYTNLDREDASMIVTENQAVEIECGHETLSK